MTLCALFCLCGVLGHLAPVHHCARLVCCVACAVSRATWLLLTGVPARCVVVRVRCPGPLGSCSPLRPPGVLCGVLGHLAPAHRCARSVCCAVNCVCGASLQGAHSFIRTGLLLAGRGWVLFGRTRVHPDGGCSAAGRGWVRCWARTRPSGRQLVLIGTCPRAVVGCVLCALSVFAATGGRRCLAPARVPRLWPAACLSGVPPGPACCAAPRPVRSLLVLQLAFPTPWCFYMTRELAPPALLGGCAGHTETGRGPGSLCLPLAPAEAGVLGSLRVIPVWGPAMGLSLGSPSGFGLGLCALRWLACVGPVTDASGFPYCPWFDRGLGRCTGAVLCGHGHLSLRVGGRQARVPCVCACSRPSWPGRAGRPSGCVLVRLPLSFGCFVFLLCSAPSGLGLPLSWYFVCPPPPLFALFFCCSPLLFFCALPLSLALFDFWPRVPWAVALCVVCFLGLALLGSPCALASFVLPAWLFAAAWWFPPPLLCLPVFVAAARCLCVFLCSSPLVRAPVVSGFLWLPTPGALGLGAVLCVFFASPFSALRALSPFLCLPLGRWLLLGGCCPPLPLPFCVSRFLSLPLGALFFFPTPVCAPGVFGFLWFPAPGALGLGAVFCLFCGPPAARLSVRSCLVCVFRLAVGCCLVVAAPPPPPTFVSRGFRRCRCAPFFFLSALCAPVVSGLLWLGIGTH